MTWLLGRHGSPAALRKAGRRKLVEVIRPKAPRMAQRLIDEVQDRLAGLTSVASWGPQQLCVRGALT